MVFATCRTRPAATTSCAARKLPCAPTPGTSFRLSFPVCSATVSGTMVPAKVDKAIESHLRAGTGILKSPSWSASEAELCSGYGVSGRSGNPHSPCHGQPLDVRPFHSRRRCESTVRLDSLPLVGSLWSLSVWWVWLPSDVFLAGTEPLYGATCTPMRPSVKHCSDDCLLLLHRTRSSPDEHHYRQPAPQTPSGGSPADPNRQPAR